MRALAVGSTDGLATHGDGFHHHTGQLLPVTILATCFLLRTHFVDDHLGAAAMGHDLELNGGVLDVGLAEVGATGILYQQNAVECHGLVDVRLKTIDVVITLGLNPQLGAGRLDDCLLYTSDAADE